MASIRARLATIKAPAGLDSAPSRRKEIAISILAEIVAVRSRQSGVLCKTP
jgi:xanthine/CO dehydrogenase XdhC/CoxF family maturation factor